MAVANCVRNMLCVWLCLCVSIAVTAADWVCMQQYVCGCGCTCVAVVECGSVYAAVAVRVWLHVCETVVVK